MGNRLQGETSPYLLQHADNPVEWYPWGPEALNRAAAENKPILLSIGYSACHWCHVMAHESFEDPETARVMNELFVNIKVDREERPDLDKIYQLAHQLLTRRSGGWPLTVFLDPQHHLPFVAGTYFPKTPRFNLPGFVQVMQRVASYFHDRTEDLKGSQQALRNVLDGIDADQPSGDTIDGQVLIRAEKALQDSFDAVNGGFGGAPKFPHAVELMFLQRRGGAGDRDDDGRHVIVNKTLTAMAMGGIYDQIGGGFFRYAVDAGWEIPHFEKMLYDNGPLLTLYAEAWLATGKPLFRRVVEETVDWVLTEMRADGGAFFSSLDADSEGEEGRYYVWDRKEVAAALPEMDPRLLWAAFGMEETPNFEEFWHAKRTATDEELASRFAVGRDDVAQVLRLGRSVLLDRRNSRVRPARDEKVVVAWNGLMIKGLARAGRLLDRPEWVEAAYRAFDFLRQNCWREGRLRAVWKDGKAPLSAYLDDHVLLIDAALELLQSSWRTWALDWAVALTDLTLERFEDSESGGFFFTASDHEKLIHRPKPFMDESLPSGNGVAASVLLALGALLGRHDYTAAAERVLRSAMPAVTRYPEAHGSLLLAVQEWLDPAPQVILRGSGPMLAAWRDYLRTQTRARTFVIADDEEALPGEFAHRFSRAGGSPVAHVCKAGVCMPPIATLEALQAELSGG